MSSIDIVNKVTKVSKDFGIPLELEFRWKEVNRARFPGHKARIKID